MSLKDTLKQHIEAHRPRTTKLTKEFGSVVIDHVTIDQSGRDVTRREMRRSRQKRKREQNAQCDHQRDRQPPSVSVDVHRVQ